MLLFPYKVETDINWTPFLSKEVRLECYLIFLEFYECLTREGRSNLSQDDGLLTHEHCRGFLLVILDASKSGFWFTS